MDRYQLKQQARLYVKESKPEPLLVSLIFIIILLILSLLTARLVGVEIDRDVIQQFIVDGDIDAFIKYISSQTPTPVESFLAAVLGVLELILSTGFTIFILNTVNAAQASYWNLLDGFGMFFRVILLYLLIGIYVFLWSLLLIVPGIIAAYKYRLAIYILIEHPEMSVSDCIRESKRLMKGYKGDLFVLDLSFIGWALLAGIPYIGYAVRVWFAPFYQTTLVLFYKQRLSIDAARDTF